MNPSGTAAEQQACVYLQQQGLILIKRNYQTRCGEIDLIMHDQTELVFVEVRYRRQARYGHALETVTTKKQHKIILAAQSYLQTYPAHASLPCRFDVVAITPDQCHWIRHAFAFTPDT